MTADIYLDSASAVPVLAEAKHEVSRALDAFGDPLGPHRTGREARSLLDASRSAVAEAIGAQPDEIVFTSGGTESVALAMWGGATAARGLGTRIVMSEVEHPAVEGAAKLLESDGFEPVRVPCDTYGRVDIERWSAEVRSSGTVLATLQHANHELGTIQPAAEAARIATEAGVRFHTDACQTVARLPIDVRALEVDLLSLSAHKFGGPPGVGALYVRRGVTLAAYPCGDDRERRRRSGMENLPGIAGMAAAVAASTGDMADLASKHWTMSETIRTRLADLDGISVHGHPTHRMPHLVCFSVDGVDNLTLAMTLDDRGVRVGAGSICSAQPGEPSSVLEAIGLPKTSGFRVGLWRGTTEDDVESFLRIVPTAVEELRRVEAASRRALAASDATAAED